MKKQKILIAVLCLSIIINGYFVTRLSPGSSKLAITSLLDYSPESSLSAKKSTPGFTKKPKLKINKPKEVAITDYCAYAKPAKERYAGKLVNVQKPEQVASSELYKVKVYVENTGDNRWFNVETTCPGEKVVALRTANADYHPSFYFSSYNKTYNGWVQDGKNSTVELLQKYVDPGEIGAFIFWVKAPVDNDYYRDVFALVAKVGDQESIIMDNKVYLDLEVGKVGEEVKKKMEIVDNQAKASELNGEKSIEIDLTHQKMNLKIGEKIVKTYAISTGAKKTPTPTGDYKVLFKQDVRVGAKWPHYVMPKFQGFTWVGHGFHALPSLGNDGGIFWTEALNHIGRPVSHGCIRLLPWDADELYAKFTEVGTPIHIRY